MTSDDLNHDNPDVLRVIKIHFWSFSELVILELAIFELVIFELSIVELIIFSQSFLSWSFLTWPFSELAFLELVIFSKRIFFLYHRAYLNIYGALEKFKFSKNSEKAN